MATMNLELQLKLQDRMSAGMKAALKAMQDGTKNARREMDGLANAANRIKPTGIERMIKALREVKSLSKSTMDTLNKTAQTGAAIGAGAYVAKRALDKPMAYDRQLAYASNTAFSSQSAAAKIAGRTTLNNIVRDTQNKTNNMGSQEDILGALNFMVGSGALGKGAAGLNSASAMLPTLNKVASGSNADIMDAAKIAMAAKQNYKMSDQGVTKALSQAVTAGNEGGFEFNSMARYLPTLMAKSENLGIGYDELLAMTQVSRITAGTEEGAAVNVENMLNKMMSKDTISDFKKQGINLPGTMQASLSKGGTSIDGFMGAVNAVMTKKPEYTKLLASAKNQSGGEQEATINKMLNLMQQEGLGNIAQDSQFMTALLAMLKNKDKYKSVLKAVRADDGTGVDSNLASVSSTLSASAERAANAKDVAAYGTEQALAGPLKSMLDGITQVATANPVLAASAYAAATALGSVAASAGIGAILNGGKGKAIVTAAKTVVGGTVARVGAGALVASAGATAAAFAMPVAALSATAFLAYATATKLGAGKVLNGTQFGEDVGRSIAVVMAQFGNKEAQEALKNDPNQKPAAAFDPRWGANKKRLAENKPIVVNVHLDGKQISSTVQTRQTKEARRH